MDDILIVIQERKLEIFAEYYQNFTLSKVVSLCWNWTLWSDGHTLRVHVKVDCHSRLTSSIPCFLYCFSHSLFSLTPSVLPSLLFFLKAFCYLLELLLHCDISMFTTFFSVGASQISSSCSVDLHSGSYFQRAMEIFHLNVLQVPHIRENSQYWKGLSRRISNQSWAQTIW